MEGDTNGGENVFCILSISHFKVTLHKYCLRKLQRMFLQKLLKTLKAVSDKWW